MSTPDPTPDPNRLSIAPQTPARKPRYFLGTFWLAVAVLLLIAGFTGHWWAILLGLAAIGYSIYLYRGGRYGFWFF